MSVIGSGSHGLAATPIRFQLVYIDARRILISDGLSVTVSSLGCLRNGFRNGRLFFDSREVFERRGHRMDTLAAHRNRVGHDNGCDGYKGRALSDGYQRALASLIGPRFHFLSKVQCCTLHQ
jgi:hypothetical protein